MTKKTFYDVLQVSPSADREIIMAAHSSLAQRYHPDKNPGNLDAEKYLKIINRAYEVLSDPVKREGYDAALVGADEIQTSQADATTFTKVTTSAPEAIPAKGDTTADGSAQTSGSGVMGLYKAVIGEKNTSYYLTKFEQFDQQGTGLKPSWNWPAFLFVGVWPLYRKMYGWFFAFCGVALISESFEKTGSPGLGAIIALGPWAAYAIYANSIYHRHVRQKIAAAQSTIRDEPKVLAYLRGKGGVNTWVLWLGLVPIIGILAAIAIPAFNDNQQRASAPQSQQPVTGGYGPNDTLVDGATPQNQQPVAVSGKDPLGLYGGASPQSQQPVTSGRHDSMFWLVLLGAVVGAFFHFRHRKKQRKPSDAENQTHKVGAEPFTKIILEIRNVLLILILGIIASIAIMTILSPPYYENKFSIGYSIGYWIAVAVGHGHSSHSSGILLTMMLTPSVAYVLYKIRCALRGKATT